jgi:hypothetical protein
MPLLRLSVHRPKQGLVTYILVTASSLVYHLVQGIDLHFKELDEQACKKHKLSTPAAA